MGHELMSPTDAVYEALVIAANDIDQLMLELSTSCPMAYVALLNKAMMIFATSRLTRFGVMTLHLSQCGQFFVVPIICCVLPGHGRQGCR